MSKATDERTTPWDVIHRLQKRYGVTFDLDVCATEFNSRCDTWYGPGGFVEDAFSISPWGASGGFFDPGPKELWMNPPYSEIPRWLGRAYSEVRKTPGLAVTCLLPASTSARWFHRWVWNADRSRPRPRVADLYFLEKRIEFEPHTTGAKWPSVVVRLKAQGGD